MKILLVDQMISGHHLKYLEAICSIPGIDFLFVLPEAIESNVRAIVVDRCKPGDIREYINILIDIIRRERIDVVHFVYGDYFYRYFGMHLKRLHKECGVIVTFHAIKRDFLRTISIKSICRCIDYAVVHTDYLLEMLAEDGIKNVEHIEYPNFTKASSCTTQQAKERLGFQIDVPVIAALGGTRFDKGLDLLLQALDRTHEPFQLLIAGREQDVTRSKIEEMSRNYSDRVRTILEYIPDDTLSDCIAAADIIALPYRKIYNGASGPLVEGVCDGKYIIGTNYGSIGRIIRRYHLGGIWDTDNVDSMVKAINDGLYAIPYKQDETATAYRESLSITAFTSKYMKLYTTVSEV